MLSKFIAPSGIGQVVKTHTVDIFPFYQREDIGNICVVVSCYSEPERYPDVPCHAGTDTIQGLLIGTIFTAKAIVGYACAIQADTDLGKTSLTDLVCCFIIY